MTKLIHWAESLPWGPSVALDDPFFLPRACPSRGTPLSPSPSVNLSQPMAGSALQAAQPPLRSSLARTEWSQTPAMSRGAFPDPRAGHMAAVPMRRLNEKQKGKGEHGLT